jgi:hypothetical protein
MKAGASADGAAVRRVQLHDPDLGAIGTRLEIDTRALWQGHGTVADLRALLEFNHPVGWVRRIRTARDRAAELPADVPERARLLKTLDAALALIPEPLASPQRQEVIPDFDPANKAALLAALAEYQARRADWDEVPWRGMDRLLEPVPALFHKAQWRLAMRATKARARAGAAKVAAQHQEQNGGRDARIRAAYARRCAEGGRHGAMTEIAADEGLSVRQVRRIVHAPVK